MMCVSGILGQKLGYDTPKPPTSLLVQIVFQATQAIFLLTILPKNKIKIKDLSGTNK